MGSATIYHNFQSPDRPRNSAGGYFFKEMGSATIYHNFQSPDRPRNSAGGYFFRSSIHKNRPEAVLLYGVGDWSRVAKQIAPSIRNPLSALDPGSAILRIRKTCFRHSILHRSKAVCFFTSTKCKNRPEAVFAFCGDVE